MKFKPITQNTDCAITPGEIDGDDTARRISIVNSEHVNTPRIPNLIAKTPPVINLIDES